MRYKKLTNAQRSGPLVSIKFPTVVSLFRGVQPSTVRMSMLASRRRRAFSREARSSVTDYSSYVDVGFHRHGKTPTLKASLIQIFRADLLQKSKLFASLI
jgi:hypothetical protein